MFAANAQLLLGLQDQTFGAGVQEKPPQSAVWLTAMGDSHSMDMVPSSAGSRPWVLSPVPINIKQPPNAACLLCTLTAAHAVFADFGS